MGEAREAAKMAFWDNIIPADSRINKNDSHDAIDAILDAACDESNGVMDAKLAAFERRVIVPLRDAIDRVEERMRGTINDELDAFEKRDIDPIREAIGHITERFRAELDALKAGAPAQRPLNPCLNQCHDPGYCCERDLCATGSGHTWDKRAGWVKKAELDGQTAWDALHPTSKKYNICVSPMYGGRSKMVVGVVKDFATAKKVVDDMNVRKPPHSCVLIWTEPVNEGSRPANNAINDI